MSKLIEPATADRFQNILGISCVENHVLMFLMQNNIDIRPLYEDSLIPLSEMIVEKIVLGKKYTDKGIVPRIHEQLRESGQLIMEMKNTSVIGLVKLAGKYEKRNMVLIQITPKFAKTELHTRAWRNDHFVRLVGSDGELLVLNDIPSLWRPVSLKELNSAYIGRILYFELPDKPFEVSVNTKALEKIYDSCDINKYKDMCKNHMSMQKLHNLLLYYKTMRHRAKDYAGQFINSEFMSEPLKNLEALLMKASYMMLHGQHDLAGEYEILKQLCKIDIDIQDLLRSNLE
ncbi:MAG TPA: hypothetical protein H9675_05625 [Firmicutes bacterium]|nr:hypothetical protein [Bacillota bacterium]